MNLFFTGYDIGFWLQDLDNELESWVQQKKWGFLWSHSELLPLHWWPVEGEQAIGLNLVMATKVWV